MIQNKKSIIQKAIKGANITTVILALSYTIITIHDIYVYGFSMETIYLITGSLIISGIGWIISFFVLFMVHAIAKAVDD